MKKKWKKRKTIAKISKTKSLSFERKNKTDKPLVRLIRKEREKYQINKINNEGDATLDNNFHDSSVGKESTFNGEDPNLIPGSGRSPGERTGYSLQYSWASLVAQLIKNLPAMGESWIPSLGWEDPLEKGTAIHYSILAWTIPWTV